MPGAVWLVCGAVFLAIEKLLESSLPTCRHFGVGLPLWGAGGLLFGGVTYLFRELRFRRSFRRRRACPCCGYRSYREPPGSYEICRICFWEDDPGQSADPEAATGANAVPLQVARDNFSEFGAVERRFLPHVRKIEPFDVREVAAAPPR